MQALRFNLKGKTAFFKKPDVNAYIYFTYGNIHKIAVLGIIGAIIGLKGYNFQGDDDYPEFYKELSNLKISIVPKNARGYIPKKVQTFNNSVGYASQEEGGNLIVREQWLEKPEWDIYIILVNNNYIERIKESFLNYSFEYIPYLGKNDHFASISDVQLLEIEKEYDVDYIHSLFLKKYCNIKNDEETELAKMWKYEEKLPIALEKETNQYVIDSFIFSNMKVDFKEKINLYNDNKKILFFY